MSESVDVFKEKILEALDALEQRKAPPRQGGEIYLNHLRNKILQESYISITEIMKQLASAGYTIEDILQLLYEIGLINSTDDVVRFRDAARRVIMSMEEE